MKNFYISNLGNAAQIHAYYALKTN